MKKISVAILASVLLAGSALAAPITTGTLVNEMVDMPGLTFFPRPAYKTVQFSSYDHRSDHPGGPNWFANSDGFGREPVPNFEAVVKEPDDKGVGEYLICDVEGPGAIVRVWSARMVGDIRMYLDGSETPVFDGRAEDFLMRTYAAYAEDAGIEDEVLADTFYQRNAAYCPIPFAQRCRIVWIGNLQGTHFYQIQIRVYDKDAKVVTFTPKDLKTYKNDIRRVSKILADPDSAWDYASKEKPVEFEIALDPGTEKTVLELSGPQGIERLSLRVTADNLDLALRQTLLYVVCDGYPWAQSQVQSPVGDFFGAAPGISPYQSVPFSVAPDGTMTCRYVLPFHESLKIVLDNRGDQPVEIKGEALPMDYAWDAARSMHFRARWRVDHDVVGSGGRVQDMPFLIANGAGVYVGTALMLLNPNCIPWPGGNWWGEGDEKIFVDDDFRPSTFGTGTEDYFNYAWSSPDIFIYPYCGQPRNDGPANRGFVTNDRWHIVDALPFNDRIAFYIELFPHEKTEGFSYARIGYHYARPGLMDDHVVITNEDLRPLELPARWELAARGGARNSVFYQAEDVLKSKDRTEIVEGNLWSAGALCRWLPKDAGDELEFNLPIAETGKYIIRLGLAQDAQSGSVSMIIDGAQVPLGGAGGVADLYVPYRILLRNFGGQQVELDKGTHSLVLRFEGALREAGAGSIGVDYIWVQKR